MKTSRFLPLLFGCFGSAMAQTTYHVDQNAAPGSANDGSSWTTALLYLQDAIDSAVTGDTILVATGTYYPDEGTAQTDNDRLSTFALKAGIILQGGYPSGGGTRDLGAHPTILSADLAQDDSSVGRSENAYHVLTAISLFSPPELDGFIISGGNADGTFSENRGGGLNCNNSAPRILNCHFQDNSSITDGGAILVSDSSTATVIDCSFENNSSHRGGAVAAYNTATFERCSFRGNTADWGGAVTTHFPNGTPSFQNCLFSGNTANSGGGANTNFSGAGPSYTNCTFQGNSSPLNGGAVIDFNSSTLFTNCLIWNNAANSSSTDPTASVFQFGDTGTSFSHCLIEHLDLTTIGTHNLDGTDPDNDPLFVSAPSPLSAPFTTADLHLSSTSPALNAGLTSTTPSLTDLDGNARILDAVIDLGCYEVLAAPNSSESDSDNDGLGDLVETILGTDPLVADFDNPNRPSTLTPGRGYTFGISPDSSSYQIDVYRSTDLDSFEKVFSYSTFDHTQISIDASLTAGLETNRITLIDSTTSAQVFYYLRVKND